ncbi:hypothetical protein Fmac_031637 [Flemingia macrophylla]|uniref:Mei2-like C-terminal RNA recognition motif domain-containing protein n=1 Tax=Flemingia macrophylla TaxID=520843 RepID=A0ABD1L2Q3_9FABA
MHHPLNPNAEPFYLIPKEVLFIPQPAYYFVLPCTLGFFSPVQVLSSDPTHDKDVKTDRIKEKLWTKGHWRCHRKFYKTTERSVKDKGRKLLENGRAFRREVVPFPNTVEEAEASFTTTVMIRNIPNQLKKHAIEKRISNLGYAFVNFTTPAAAFKFYRDFQGFEWNVAKNRKICEINVAQFQGKDTLMRIFQEKVFRCESRDFLPVVFSGGRDGVNRRIKGSYVGNHIVKNCGYNVDNNLKEFIGEVKNFEKKVAWITWEKITKRKEEEGWD